MKALDENIPISRYSIHQSYVNQFVNIINYGIIEWTYVVLSCCNKI